MLRSSADATTSSGNSTSSIRQPGRRRSRCWRRDGLPGADGTRAAAPAVRAACQRPRRAAADFAGALLADLAVFGRLAAGLPHARIEAEIADQLPRRLEPGDVADRAQQRDRGDALTPGRVISRSASSSLIASAARIRSSRSSSSSTKSIWRRHASTVSRSSSGSRWTRSASQARSPTPNRLLIGGRSIRLRCRAAWIWFFSRVRWRTSAQQRRRVLAASSGVHTRSRNPTASSCASTLASSLSVFARREVSRTAFGLASTTRRTGTDSDATPRPGRRARTHPHSPTTAAAGTRPSAWSPSSSSRRSPTPTIR